MSVQIVERKGDPEFHVSQFQLVVVVSSFTYFSIALRTTQVLDSDKKSMRAQPFVMIISHHSCFGSFAERPLLAGTTRLSLRCFTVQVWVCLCRLLCVGVVKFGCVLVYYTITNTIHRYVGYCNIQSSARPRKVNSSSGTRHTQHTFVDSFFLGVRLRSLPLYLDLSVNICYEMVNC